MIWTALKRWGGWVASAVLVVFGAGWLWSRRSALSAEARRRVAELRKEVSTSKRARDLLLRSAADHTARINALAEDIDSKERAIVAHHEPVEGLTRDQIREKLRRLGY